MTHHRQYMAMQLDVSGCFNMWLWVCTAIFESVYMQYRCRCAHACVGVSQHEKKDHLSLRWKAFISMFIRIWIKILYHDTAWNGAEMCTVLYWIHLLSCWLSSSELLQWEFSTCTKVFCLICNRLEWVVALKVHFIWSLRNSYWCVSHKKAGSHHSPAAHCCSLHCLWAPDV